MAGVRRLISKICSVIERLSEPVRVSSLATPKQSRATHSVTLCVEDPLPDRPGTESVFNEESSSTTV
jgi:hypothetical protein